MDRVVKGNGGGGGKGGMGREGWGLMEGGTNGDMEGGKSGGD